jgi:Flp pilus assembly protein TadG
VSSGDIKHFARSEEGALTQFSLLWLVLTLAVGGLAVDVSNGYRERARMQDAADSAALGAIYLASDPTTTLEVATDKAIALAQQNLGNGSDQVVTNSDVVFGYFNEDTGSFQTNYSDDENLNRAVKVTASRSSDRQNETPTFLTRFAGHDGWEINTSAVAEAYLPACLVEGLSANGVIDLQSGNTFASGFCLYAKDYVSLNQNNVFEPGAIVSMPDISKLDIPASGFTKNDGLKDSLRTAFYKLRIIDRINEIINSLEAGSSFLPDYITDKTIYTLTPKAGKVLATSFESGKMYRISCSNKSVTIDGDLLRDTVVFASCPIKFAQAAGLENVIFTNTSTDAKSFSAPSGLRLGENDNCAEGGGAQLITMGGVSNAAKMEFYGGQIIAAGDVSFSAQSKGIDGIAIVSGGGIDGTSNSTFGHCGSGMEDNIALSYFRLRL